MTGNNDGEERFFNLIAGAGYANGAADDIGIRK